MIDDNSTLKEIKEHLQSGWVKGTSCPACKQLVKIYPHQINSAIARVLIRMYNSDAEWINIFRDLKPSTTMYSIAAFWKLIEPKGDEPENNSKSSGYWRLTEKGRLFVENNLDIPKHAYIYNNQVRGFSAEEISIVKALGKKFDYAELMGYTT